jgi:hypothetical protein
MRLSVVLAGAACIAAVTAAPAEAQRRGNFQRYFGSPDEFYQPPDFHGNPLYDGHFVFARIKYRGFRNWAGNEGPGWSHDYPRADYDFVRILRDVTVVNPFVEQGPIVGAAIVALDDPALFKYPVSYMSEPGGWEPNDKELAGFRSYMLKGGFMIFDDFREGWRGNDWTHLREIVRAAIPSAKWVQLTGGEPIFDSFFKIDLKLTINSTSSYGVNLPTYWGVYQDNDPKKRLMIIANVDNDIGESWQWSASGFIPITSSNELYKLGINYIIYALTH